MAGFLTCPYWPVIGDVAPARIGYPVRSGISVFVKSAFEVDLVIDRGIVDVFVWGLVSQAVGYEGSQVERWPLALDCACLRANVRSL